MRKPIRPARVRLETAACPFPSIASADADPLGAMAATLAHDINNILQVVTGNLSLIARDLRGDRDQRLVDAAFCALQTGEELTGNVLELCRLRSPALQTEISVTSQHLAGMMPLIASSVGQGIDVSLDVAGDLGVFSANLHRLRNALLNLAINAREAMGGHGTLALEASNDASPDRGSRVLVSMIDNGPGIPADKLDRIFQPFFTTKTQGTGLGLAIVAEFARSCRADISVESDLGRGTRVTIEFPRLS